jgi:hypothetical protein
MKMIARFLALIVQQPYRPAEDLFPQRLARYIL